MIIDLEKFTSEESVYWKELERILARLERNPDLSLDLPSLQRFHYLYQRASSDLGRMATFAAEQQIHTYLEALVSRAYAEIHESREISHRLRPIHWFFKTFPQSFRRHIIIFWISLAITACGVTFGGIMVAFDSDAKEILMPFQHILQDPSERVKSEEEATTDPLAGSKAAFSSHLMTHNTQVSIFALAMGMTYGIGTILLLFHNGVILGAVALDYVLAGESTFLMGWLMPHGVIEIPAILIAGQAGLLLARTLIGWGKRIPLRGRLRAASPDLLTLIAGVALLLVWAGLVEAFLSQYHEPVIPYFAKITFGVLELLLLILFLSMSGREP